MKKRLIFSIFLVFVLAVAGYGAYWYFLKPVESIRPIYLVPKDAIYIVETTEPIQNWEQISQSEPWQHLKQQPYIAELTSSADYLDTLIKDNKRLFDLIGSRTVLISAHMYKRDDYDFLYIIDLEKVSQFGALQHYLENLVGDMYKVTRRTYLDTEIVEMYDPTERETLYLSFIQNLLLVSYRHNLIEAAIEQKDLPVIGRDFAFIDINQEISGRDMFRLYFQYASLDEYMQCYTAQPDPSVVSLSQWLKFTGASFRMEEEGMLRMEGYTNLNDTLDSYLTALLNSGNGKSETLKVSPQRTAFYMGLGFGSFETFFENLENTMQSDAESFAAYQENTQKLEKFLDISLKEHFVGWIDDELAFIQTQPSGLGEQNEFAIVLKAKSAKEAQENLQFIGKQIRKKTPVKFKEVVYRDYPIRFMSVKGFFKMILGKFFSKLEKPYYTIIENFVIFSNHPQTIKNFIDDYVDQKTLTQLPDFKQFQQQFSKKANATIYLQTPVMYNNLQGFVDAETWKALQENKQYITCFSDIGFQLTRDGDRFKTVLSTRYQDPTVVAAKMRARQAKPAEAVGPTTVSLDDLLVDVVEAFRNISPDSMDVEEMISVDEIVLDDLDAKKQREYYEDGETLKIEVSLKDGLKHGSYREYYENGNLKVKGRYKNDAPTGVWHFYDENGRRIEKRRY